LKEMLCLEKQDLAAVVKARNKIVKAHPRVTRPFSRSTAPQQARQPSGGQKFRRPGVRVSFRRETGSAAQTRRFQWAILGDKPSALQDKEKGRKGEIGRNFHTLGVLTA